MLLGAIDATGGELGDVPGGTLGGIVEIGGVSMGEKRGGATPPDGGATGDEARGGGERDTIAGGGVGGIAISGGGTECGGGCS